MYEEYFGLKKKPFSIVPDPACFYMSDGHREALAHLLFGTTGEGGFVLLTGEVGTGKTTVCRRLLEVTTEETEVAFILNPKLSAEELLAAICDEFRIEYPEGTTSTRVLVARINDYLLSVHERGRRAVLIIEEAQNLAPEVLEQVRLLTNLETREKKLLQVIMIGQPELKEMLSRPELRQLSQRITARYHLGPLSRREVQGYIDYRLSTAGVARVRPFTPSAMRRVYRLTKGIPRLINVVCDRALLGAFVEGKEHVDAKTLKKAAREAAVDEGRGKVRTCVAAGLLLFAVLSAIGCLYYYRETGAARLAKTRAVIPAPAPQAPAAAAEAAKGEAEKGLAVLSRPSGSGAATRTIAYGALFRAWNLAYHGEDRAALCDKAASHGLACLSGTGSIATLREMNHPAVLRLVDEKNVEYYGTLLALSGENATIVIGGETKSVDIARLARAWSGDYLVLWRTPPGYAGELKPGSKGRLVAWLERRLAAESGRPSPAVSGAVYDEATERRVRQFQIASGMTPDGLAGPRTIMRLSGRVKGGGDPVLFDAKGAR